MLRADLHVHTTYSFDCVTKLEHIVARCLEVGINCIAVADHHEVNGALELQRFAPFRVIVGEEILTSSGEIMGLFLQESIPGRLSPEETITRIKEQDGLVCIPHPFSHLTRAALNHHALEALLPHIDLIEAFNSRSILLRDSAQASKFARDHELPCSAGSDAHILKEIGNAYVEMSDFNSPPEFIQALSQGRIFGHRTNPLVHLLGLLSALRRRL